MKHREIGAGEKNGKHTTQGLKSGFYLFSPGYDLTDRLRFNIRIKIQIILEIHN